MELKQSISFKDVYDISLKDKIKKLMDMYSNEFYKGNKVAFLYKDKDNTITFNEDICFYAASTIKILTVLLMFKKIDNNEFSLDDNILVKMEDLKQDSGIIKFQKEDTNYTIKELLRLTIVESDNTAYLKLVSLVGGKSVLKEFGNSLGAIHTMEGKETDSFGIINCSDMFIYIKNVIDYIKIGSEHSNMLREWMLNTTTKKVSEENVNGSMLRKGGEYGIAYHEVGYVESDNPYFMIILTQLNEFDYKNKFINDTAKMLKDINSYLRGNK